MDNSLVKITNELGAVSLDLGQDEAILSIFCSSAQDNPGGEPVELEGPLGCASIHKVDGGYCVTVAFNRSAVSGLDVVACKVFEALNVQKIMAQHLK